MTLNLCLQKIWQEASKSTEFYADFKTDEGNPDKIAQEYVSDLWIVEKWEFFHFFYC